MDDIEAKLDVLIEMYKANRQTDTAAGDNAAPLTSSSSSSRLRHGPPLSLRSVPADVESSTSPPPQPTASQSLRRGRSPRPMLRNLSDLGPRVACRSTPPVSVRLTATDSPAEECLTSASDQHSPAASTPSSRRHPSIICESNDELNGEQFPSSSNDDHNDSADAVELLPLPVADDDETRTNHIAPQQFADHVNSPSNVIGRTVSPSDNSQTVAVL